jgi:hypothetical protein
MFEKLASKIVADSGKDLATPAEIIQLKSLQKEFVAARDTMNQNTVLTAYAALIENQTRMAKAVRGGALSDHDGWTREDFEEDALQKSNASKDAMKQITAEATVVARPIADKMAVLSNQAAADVEKAEADVYQQWGMLYVASSLVLTLRKCADTARSRIPTSDLAEVPPCQMLPYLDLE